MRLDFSLDRLMEQSAIYFDAPDQTSYFRESRTAQYAADGIDVSERPRSGPQPRE